MALGIRAGRHRSLLAALLLRPNQLLSVGHLIEAVWDGEAPPGDGPAALRNYVARLRRTLGPEIGARIHTRSPGYLIEVGDDELDVLRFTSLYQRAKSPELADQPVHVARHLGEALALWRGTPLADIPTRGYHRHTVDRLHEMRLQALERRIDAELQLGAHREVIGELCGLTTRHRTREPFHRQLMLALYRSGRQAEALDAFQQVRQSLVADLGIEPGAALQDLHQRILAGDTTLEPRIITAGQAEPSRPRPSSPARVPAEVPAEPRDFTGRAQQVEELLAQLTGLRGGTPGMSAAVALAGPAGIGKTALALHVARRARDEFPDGQLYADLRGSTDAPADPAEILTRFLRSLGAEPSAPASGADELANLLRTVLVDRKVLLVLDDAADAGQVRPLLPGAGASAVLITSRGQLAALESASRLRLRALPTQESAELFARITGTDASAAPDEDAVAAVLEVCAGLPLAVRIAASRIDAGTGLTVSQLAEQLADPVSRLDALRIGDLSVRRVLDSAHARLGGPSGADGPDRADGDALDPAQVFAALATVADAPFTATTVAHLLDLPTTAVQQALIQLVNRGLLTALPAGLHRLHPLPAAYARERAESRENESTPATPGCQGLTARRPHRGVEPGRSVEAGRGRARLRARSQDRASA